MKKYINLECPECKSTNCKIEDYNDEYEAFECNDCGYYQEQDIEDWDENNI